MLLIGNGRVITRDPERPYLERGAVVTDGAKIAAVGEYDALKRHIRTPGLWTRKAG